MPIIPTEADECKALTVYLEILQAQKKIALFSHIPNETSIKNWGYISKMKAMGKRSGVPDYIIILNDPKRIIWVEMKRSKGGIIYPSQTEWISQLNYCNTPAYIAYGYEDAKNFIDLQLKK